MHSEDGCSGFRCSDAHSMAKTDAHTKWPSSSPRNSNLMDADDFGPLTRDAKMMLPT